MGTTIGAGRGGAAGHLGANPAGSTVALVDLRSEPGGIDHGGEPPERVSANALRTIEQAVRSGDRVCPFGTSWVAVAFGPDADAVTPKKLAVRLARAIRRSAAREGERTGSRQPVRGDGDEASEPVVAAIPAATTIVVDRAMGPVGFRRRTVVRCSAGSFARYGTRHDDVATGDRGTILVVSPCRTPGGAPGLSALAATAMAERVGFEVGTVALSCDDEILLDVRGAPVELVVLMVEGEREPVGDRTTWTSSSWHIPAQLTTRFRARGINVLAVGAGGGAGALASCAVQGARVLLDLDDLLGELRAGHQVDGHESWGATGPELPVPPRLAPLVLLTASERRVLFYLTTGRSAQEIADDLVVSVTTVRSHIRSILRKLGVRSQLAAVAIANSRDVRGTEDAGSPSDLHELTTPGVA